MTYALLLIFGLICLTIGALAGYIYSVNRILKLMNQIELLRWMLLNGPKEDDPSERWKMN